MKIRKRTGALQVFDISRITAAITKALVAVDGPSQTTDTLAADMSYKVLMHDHFRNAVENEVIDIEDIQDTIETVLAESGRSDVAKAFSEYRQKRADIRKIEPSKLIKDYIGELTPDEEGLDFVYEPKEQDWRVKENATVGRTVGGYILYSSGTATSNVWLEDVYDREISDAHRNADIHIHDLSMLTGYCAGWSLKQLIQLGISGVEGKISSAPAKHLSTLCNQMVNFLGIMQNEWAGAQALSSFDTYLAPFVKKDGLTYSQVKQCLQNFVYGVNTPSRWGTQAPFTNITLDWTVPNDLADLPCLVGGKEMPYYYRDCQKEMDMVNKAFLEIMIEGDANGRGFQYPIPTYSITRDFDWSDTENNRLLFEMTAKYGTPYFSNYINSDMEPSDVRSMCCRLRLDLRELRKKSGGFFGSGESTGSVGVVTINMPRIAYNSSDEDEFFRRLDHIMDVAARSLKIKRNYIEKLMSLNFYPYTKAYLGSFNNHFSTIGLVGMNEACLNACWIEKDLTAPVAQDFTEKVLNHMRERLSDYQEEYGDLYNLEATPAESTSYRLAKHDRKRWPDIKAAGTPEAPYYTNSSHLPVSFTDDMFAALDIQDRFQTLYTSGTVFHAFLGEKLPDWQSAAKLVRTIANTYKLPYYTISPTYSICKEHGYIAGEHTSCPFCGAETEVYSRITGYYRPVKNWNIGKAQEYSERKTYQIPTISEGGSSPDADASASEHEPKTKIEGTWLFTTSTCPRCKEIKSFLEGKLDSYTVLTVDMDDRAKTMALSYGIRTAPSLVIGGNVLSGPGAIRKYFA